MSEDGAPGDDDAHAALLDLLADDYARTILVATSREPMSASTLSEEFGMSLPTVYRRVERLEAFDLLTERTEIDTSGGHHRSLYAANLTHLDVDLDDGTLSIAVQLREDAVDRFTRLWHGIRSE